MACPHCGGEHPAETKDCPLTGRPIPPPRPALAPGELLEGKYQIKRELGRGAMGIVYEALHVSLGRRVAVKTLIEGAGADAELGARFEREARAASAIGHPHIIDVFDLGRTRDGLLFMVMELLDGKPLEALLRREPMLPLELTIDVMAQVLSGLAAAHKNGIVHRDLKPDNIFILDTEERRGFVKLVDFGISKVLGPKASGPPGARAFAGTMVGSVLGTPLYMSPEQAIGQVAAIDHRTDIYSAGVVLYEMLCGRTPFTGKSYPEVLGQILEGKYRKPRELRPDLPPEIEAVIARAMARDIEARYPTAAAMRAELTAGKAEITLAPVPLAPPPPQATPGLSPLPPPSPAKGEPLVLADQPAPPRASARRGSAPGSDPFAPPPDAELAPELALDRSLAVRPSRPAVASPAPEPAPAPRARPRPPRPAPPARAAESAAAESAASAVASAGRGRRWLLLGSALLLTAVGASLAYATFGRGGKVPLLPRIAGKHKVSLAVEPKEASVQIDHVPVAAGVLPLDTAADRPHILNAAAPGRITRRFSFVAKPGLALAVRLSHTLEPPRPTDPPPLAAELDADYPESPRPAAEIDAAFGKLAHYADCLSLLDRLADGKKGRARGRVEPPEPCQLATAAGPEDEPGFPELESAARGYLTALERGSRADALARTAAAARAEYLAARTAWQIEELSRQEEDEGQTAAWHLRRVALATQAWLRGQKAGPAASQVAEDRRAKLDSAFTMLTGFIRQSPHALARTSGAADFLAAAEEAVALASGAGGRKATEFAALDACRKVTAAFNALVVE